MNPTHRRDRRGFLYTAAVSSLAVLSTAPMRKSLLFAADPQASERKPTIFQHACMTLPYSAFPWERALTGIQAAGYRHVAWGVQHREENGEQVPVLAEDAASERAKTLAKRCRDLGLEPVMMFSTVYPEHPKGLEVLTQRIKQAGAAGIAQVLTFGHTQGGNRDVWIKRFKALGSIARDHNVTIVVKQHGGTTGTGVACAEIIREVNHPNVFVNYDAGNVMDYLDVDPIPDIRQCAAEIRSFCVKDHRNWPKDQDCGPGFGEIDHYRLFEPVAFTGQTMPLAYENIFAPLVPRPSRAEQIDALARRAREFVEAVVAGLQRVE
jgi:sugar phosphate isomerase/epimerase